MKNIAVLKEYSVAEFLTAYDSTDDDITESFTLDGVELFKRNVRYRLFARSQSCSYCGLEGNLLRLEQSTANGSVGCFLYHRTASGELILMNRDHVIPKSKGGHNGLSNAVLSCEPCNQGKGDSCDSTMLEDVTLKFMFTLD